MRKPLVLALPIALTVAAVLTAAGILAAPGTRGGAAGSALGDLPGQVGLPGSQPRVPGAGLPGVTVPGVKAGQQALSAAEQKLANQVASLPAGYLAEHARSAAQLSSVVQLARSGLDGLSGNDDAGVGDSFPATGIPRVPAGFAPNVIVNQDRSATPHNETSVAINPRNPLNVVVGANDYSLGFGSSGMYSSFDGGASFYGAVLPMPTVYFQPPASANGEPPRTLLALDGGGDPSVAFDRDGTAYYAEINFHRVGCASGVFVYRSTNGGQTWNRPLDGNPSTGDTRVAGDGVVAADSNDNDCSTFYDKEMISTGPRPNGAPLAPNTDTAHLASDRLYVTYSNFSQVPPVAAQPYVPAAAAIQSPTMMAYSDDQGRHWSAPAYIGGTSSDNCGQPSAFAFPPAAGVPTPNSCIDSQGSDSAVDPHNGAIYVVFANLDNIGGVDPTTYETSGGTCPTQELVVSSTDGGQTWSSPAQVTCVSPTGVPTAASSNGASTTQCPGEPSGETLISDYCFRVPPQTQQAIAVSPVDGSVHACWASNRGGTDWDSTASGAKPSDYDVFTAASSDGGQTWGKPVRVNTRTARDQFFPWCAYGPDGTYYVSFLDRSVDSGGKLIGESVAWSKDGGRTFTEKTLSTGGFDGGLGFRAGLFLGDYTGVAAGRLGAFAAWPDTRRSGQPIPGNNPPDFWSDVAGAATYGLHASVASSGVVPAPSASPAPPSGSVQAANTTATAPAAGARSLPNTAGVVAPAGARLTPLALGGLGLVVVGARLVRRRRRLA
jgi:hypothetical protein